jgi:hypothetical protein
VEKDQFKRKKGNFEKKERTIKDQYEKKRKINENEKSCNAKNENH